MLTKQQIYANIKLFDVIMEEKMVDRFEEFVSNITRAHKAILKIKAYEMQEFGLKAANVMTLYFVMGLSPKRRCDEV